MRTATIPRGSPTNQALWRRYFERHGASKLAYYLKAWTYNAPLFAAIQEVRPPPATLLEIGVGSGALAIALSGMGYTVIGLDQDETFLELAKQKAEAFGVPLIVWQGDAFALDCLPFTKIDLAYSSGVLEHFHEPAGIRLLEQQAHCAPIVVLAVPTKRALAQDPGEVWWRPLGWQDLNRMGQAAGLNPILRFAYGGWIPGARTLGWWTAGLGRTTLVWIGKRTCELPSG